MGYGYYTLPDGREAGYGVEAECDEPGCATVIDRGLGYLCGDNPVGWNDFDAPGCGNYFCGSHTYEHDCAAPQCPEYHRDGWGCDLIAGHDGFHWERSASYWPDSEREEHEE